MQLIAILLVTVSILAVLSGVSVLIGASKGERLQSLMFFLATLGVFAWSMSMAIFLTVPGEQPVLARNSVLAIYASTLIMNTFIIAYAGWKIKFGKFVVVLSAICSAIIITMLFYDPSLMYSSITIGHGTNSVQIVNGWFYWTYAGFCVLQDMVFMLLVWYKVRHASNQRIKKGWLVFLIGLMIAGIGGGLFDLLLPLYRYDLIWVGPLAVSAGVILHYYAILRYRVLILSNIWLKLLSYIVLMSLAAIAYMVIFFLIFTALFHIPNPSTAVIVLNFIMIVIVLLLLPVINEVSAFIRSLISVQQVDIAYIVKKLNQLATQNVNLNELAAFLADHLHFQYIGLVVNGRLYGSKSLAISAQELSEISMLETEEKGIWQKINGKSKELFEKLDLKAVAELRNAKGRPFGQILVGKPLGKMSFERRDLIQLEMIINLVAVVIDSEKHLKA